MSVVKGIGLGLVALLIVGALSVGGYYGYWNLLRANTNRQSNIDRQNNGTQLGYRKAIHDKMVDVRTIDVQLNDPRTPSTEDEVLRAQRLAIVNDICGIWVNVTVASAPADEQQFAAANCN
jgi:hypothetical protein